MPCLLERTLHAARTFSRSRNPMGGTPYLQMWYVYLIRSSYQWIIQQGYMSQRNNSSSFFVLHSWTTILQPNFSYSHHDRSTHAKDVLLVHGKSCSSIDYTGWNSSWTLQLCDWKKNRIRCVRYYIRYERGEWIKRVSLREPIPTETFCHKSVVYDSSTDWHFVVMWDFCLQHPTQPIQWQVHPGLCPTSHQRKYTLHLKFSTSTKFSFYQQRWLHSRIHLCTTWWSRTLGALIPSYGVMQALDQVRSLSDSVQKLANDTVLALGNIKDTLASHKMMILQNRVALDYILATQGGACTIIGPECCTGLMDPTENLNKIQQDILGLSENYTRWLKIILHGSETC